MVNLRDEVRPSLAQDQVVAVKQGHFNNNMTQIIGTDTMNENCIKMSRTA
jgi:hypothetical protein